MGCKVVQEPLFPGSRHWYLPNSILDRLQVTIPESILPSQCRNRHHQHVRGVFILSRKPDSGQLLRQFPNPNLGHQIHRPPDSSGKILLWTQIEHPKPNRYYALWITYRHRSGGLVRSSPEDWLGMVGKRSILIYALVNNHDPYMLCPS